MDAVERLVQSGAAPLELYYQSVVSTEFGSPVAYRSQLRVSDPDLGVLLPEQYLPVVLRTTQCLDLANWHLNGVMDAVDALCEREAAFDWVSMYTPVRMLMKTDMAVKVARMLSEREFIHPNQILFEFPEELLFEDLTEAAARLTALREMGLRVGLAGFGSEFCPAMRLSALRTDCVIMDESVALDMNEGDGTACRALINLAMETGASVVLDGASQEQAEDAYRHNAYALTGKISGKYKKLSALLK